jgi:signal transduction histidine kinase
MNGPMPLRAYLLLLALATIVPVVAFGAVVGYFLIQEQRETFRRGAEERTLAVLTAIDNELAGSVSTLEALATLPSLDDGNLAAFRSRARRVLAVQPDWHNINLALPDGQQVMNLQVPAGKPLPNIGRLDGSFGQIRETGQPVVSDLAVGPVLKRWSFAVRVPVFREGSVRYVLSAGVRAESISRVVLAQGLPPDWVGVVVDRNGRIVARSYKSEETVGQLASTSLRGALEHSRSGWFAGATIEGAAVYTPFRRSDRSDWTFAMGIPAAAVDGAARRAAGLLAIGLLGALLLALVLAHVVGRRISAPISALASAAAAIGRGERVEVPATARIDEIRRLAGSLRESLEMLQLADRQKDEFLAMLSHELRNPLAAISTSTYLLEVAEPGSSDASEARAIIDRQTRHMARLVGDLLDINRINLGKLPLQRTRFDLAAAVSDVVRGWRQSERLEERDLSLTVEPCRLQGDRARIEQIIDNLIDNAIKFTSARGRIALSVSREAGTAVVRVTDNGIGLTREECDRVFELFAQGERTQGGLGLGLALVKRLAELHGGNVSVFSDGPGRGATIELRLPLDNELDQPAANSAGVVMGIG